MIEIRPDMLAALTDTTTWKTVKGNVASVRGDEVTLWMGDGSTVVDNVIRTHRGRFLEWDGRHIQVFESA